MCPLWNAGYVLVSRKKKIGWGFRGEPCLEIPSSNKCPSIESVPGMALGTRTAGVDGTDDIPAPGAQQSFRGSKF